MEPAVVGCQKRLGRKRRIDNVQNMMVDCSGKKRIVETRSMKLVGRYVRKKVQGSGVFLGRIIVHNSGMYRIKYEDGDCEDLCSRKVKAFLMEDADLTGKWSEKRQKLDESLLNKDVNQKVSEVDNGREPEKSNLDDSSLLSKIMNGDVGGSEVVKVHDCRNGDVDVDSLSDSCEDPGGGGANLDMEVPLVPPPELPPSSGHIGIQEEYVSHLLSVYSFLRSFSVPLFLYPFGLNDFVGALNSSAANTLLDSVHVALMRVLKHHLQRLSLDGSELASKCLRCPDWGLLDTLTWPIYLVQYLMVMGYKNGPDWKGFYIHSLGTDYYTLSAGKKLTILQILCEDVLDSEELRTEMDLREESEVGIDTESKMEATISEPKRVHRRYSKASASKDTEPLQSVAEHCEIKSSHSSHFLESQAGGPIGNSIDEYGNGDECRLCSMDGLLVCCDGCPSSYHPRCLGLNRMLMPDGSWYCPECEINATEPKLMQGTALRGGENFGVDPYEQVFVASCDHLLVLKASINSGNCLRYYNRHDIPGVLHALYSKAECFIMYSGICRGIMKYWGLLQEILPCKEISEVGFHLVNKTGSGDCISQSVNLLDKSVTVMTEVDNTGSHKNRICEDLVPSCLTYCVQQPVLSGNSLDTAIKSDRHEDPTREQSGVIMTMTEPGSFSSSIGQPADPCELSQQSTSSVTQTVSCPTTNINVKYRDPLNGTSLEAKASTRCLELNNRVDGKACGSSYDGYLYMGSYFKATDYINYYLHGDFAASAAANLAGLSSEENKVPESRPSDNRQKAMSASIVLQFKAFSAVAMRFFWPNMEKKLVEVPRERCSWCFSCKAPVASKRGCLLNAAALNATRGRLAGVRPMKNGDGRLSSIAAYIMFMEQSLSGLIVGPFLNATFRKQWRNQVEQATTCNVLKILLLELEENVRTIAFSRDWTKFVGGCSPHSSTSQIVATAAGSTQKRRPGRRARKTSTMVEVAVDSQDMSADFTWWRGDILSKHMLQRAILPCSIIKKSARQGGTKKIPGVHYVDGNETPKISRRLVWRSAVEISRNTAQLALQVRYLDFHVRWGDLIRPEQTSSDGKGPQAEASAFRNAFICDKKIVEQEIRYCAAFGSQKHLPSRVMKNIIEEQILDDGKERYWFCQTYIPLYLIREYEQKVEENKPVHLLPKLQTKQLKASRKNIFSNHFRKQDNMVWSYCCSCHQDVFFRNAVKCSGCQGLCHVQCATSSTVNMNEVEYLITCKQCCEIQSTIQVEKSNVSPTSPLHLQGQESPNPANVTKHVNLVGYKGSPAVGTLEHPSAVKSITCSAVATRSRKLHWGLIWRKKNYEDTGMDFRLKNILLRGNLDRDLPEPLCRLCNQPYNANLIYIRCETCQYWFHADSVELDESKIIFLVGFRCCKCRRIKSPVCPYLDPEKNKVLEGKTERRQAGKLEISMMNFGFDRHKEVGTANSALPGKPGVSPAAADDPLVSLSEVKQCTGDKSEVDYEPGPAPPKLPIRRLIKEQKDIPCQAGRFQFDVSAPFEANIFKFTAKLPVKRHITNSFQIKVSDLSEANAVSSTQDSFSPHVQRIASKENLDDSMTLENDCLSPDDIKFDPRTYFSFNELLAPDDCGHANGKGSPDNGADNMENSALAENGTLEMLYDREDPVISLETVLQRVPCKICSNTKPHPDLSCQICGMWIHKHCSPWFESSSWEDGWRCGNCREWR
ncbi:DDT domain-containing protein PTM-like [Sesamum indicum]|uniref:DDT domain-containing protein PTM-like n=1 Tax=Sesamum indicum TaxID=4182 RepID=A0A6I9TTK7_SESIN|nr:DDT domain-containing protein PTM-like [Sesamum indicum]